MGRVALLEAGDGGGELGEDAGVGLIEEVIAAQAGDILVVGDDGVEVGVDVGAGGGGEGPRVGEEGAEADVVARLSMRRLWAGT